MDGIIAYALAKKYVKESLVGVGAIKGAPCTIQSITSDSDGNSVVTFKWTATDDTERTSTMTVLKGVKGDKGDTGNSAVHYGTEAPTDPEIKIWVDPEGTPYEMPVAVVGQRLIFN